jgi:hypothetical protein
MDRIKCYTSGDEIKFLDDMTEADKPEFHDITDEELNDMFKHLIPVEVVEDDEDETIEIPDNINYEIYGADWYRMKFPGFDEEHYELMAKAANYTETEKTPEPRISSEISTE